MTCQVSTYQSPIGLLALESDGVSLTGLWIEGQKHFDLEALLSTGQAGSEGVLREAEKWLDDYFAGGRPNPKRLPIAPKGSEFRQLVWRHLLNIPYAQTVTYGHLAKMVACDLGKSSMSAQAIGGAVGSNPISIVIPCHRVIGADGSLIGYASGLAKKMKLLAHEGVDQTQLKLLKESELAKE